MIIIDYLQLMQADINKGGNREQEISKISRDLKSLAKELEIPIIALSQLNRGVESRKESKVPQLSDLRESGAIEQDADMVMFLYRPEYYGINNDEMGNPIEGETHVHIAKNRSGTTDTVKVRFIKEYQKFVDIEEDNGFGGFGGGGNNFGGGGGNNFGNGGNNYGSGNYGGGNFSGGGKAPFNPADNPLAGIKRDPSEFGGSKMFIPGGFQTLPSKANNFSYDDDEDISTPFKKPQTGQQDDDIPF
jgi:replicative DNA helicase